MKSMRLSDSGQTLSEAEVPQPAVKAGEVLVRVHAAGVTPTEVAWYPTTHTKDGNRRNGAVLVHEFSGEIAELGDGVKGLAAGQEIYGMNDWFDDGALAEYCLTRPEWIADKPSGISHVEAASVPVGALTAWQGLLDRAKLRAGERVLVHGGAGAVGIFAIQLAHLHGAYVITTVSANNTDFVKSLGADEALDYKAGPFEEKLNDIDLVFDAVGGNTLQRSWRVLNETGRLVTIAADNEGTSDERAKQSFFIVEPRRDHLVEIGKLLDAGDLKAVVDTVSSLSEAAELFSPSVARSGRGKMVVRISQPGS